MYSPNFPWNYPNSKECEWHITVPWNKKVNLKFIKFDLEQSDNCGYDFVEVKYLTYYYVIRKFCGSQIPSSITSSSSLRVRFNSDSGVTKSGFLAFYQTGDSFPTQIPTPIFWTTYRPVYPTPTSSAAYQTCRYNSQTLSKCVIFPKLTYYINVTKGSI